MVDSKFQFIAVDLQYDFTRPDGAGYSPRPCVDFIKSTLLPALRERGITVREIISDYRQPRPGDPRVLCIPGEWGYTSEIPIEAKAPDVWIKSMNSPSWTREGAGIPEMDPGSPRPDPEGLSRWLMENIGSPRQTEAVLFGLTLDRCILCTAQELTFRGYKVHILMEGTDTRSGDREEKEYLLNNPPIIYWATAIDWNSLKIRIS